MGARKYNVLPLDSQRNCSGCNAKQYIINIIAIEHIISWLG